MKKTTALLLAPLMTTVPTLTSAEALSRGAQIEVEMHEVNKDGTGKSLGSIRIANHQDGVLFEPDLEGLEPGLHGFHLHENPDCGPAEKDGEKTPGAAAGGHFDPYGKDDKHRGPYEEGHLGDLPPLYADEDGKASIHVLAPRLEYDHVPNRALVIHEGGDNYSDDPEPLGGGGARVACGLVSPD